jgi:FkbM family methyltransferase
VKVKTRHGQFAVFTEHDLISRSLIEYGEWAHGELEILHHFITPGDTVVDAGAYIGTHTAAFSLMVGSEGTVHSFEPNPKANALLAANVLENKLSNVRIHAFALGETHGRIKLKTGEQTNIGATRIQSVSKTSKKGAMIQPLDSVPLKNLKFVKADVEGWEIALLRGASIAIGKFRPTIFIECNSLQAILELFTWLEENKYISYGVLAEAFNPNNFGGSKENIFGPSKECGLLLIPKEHSSSVSAKLQRLQLPLISTVDDAVLLLLHKPQYAYEVLEKSPSATALGINYPSPALSDARGGYEIEVLRSTKEVLELRDRLGSLTRSLEEDCAIRLREQEARGERKLQEMGTQLEAVNQTIGSLQQEMLLQRASFHKKAHEANLAHVALEKELQEELLASQRSVESVRRDWETKLVEHREKAEQAVRELVMQLEALTLANQSVQQEVLTQQTAFYKASHDANQAHAELERQLRQDLFGKEMSIEVLERDWAAKLREQKAEGERHTQSLTTEIESLALEKQSLQQDILAQKAALFKEINDTKQAHAEIEGLLRQDLSTKQAGIEILQAEWAAKLGAADRKAELLTEQVESQLQAMYSLQQEALLQRASFYKRANEANQAHVALERELQDELLWAQREMETLARDWVARMADQEAHAKGKLEALNEAVGALRESLLLASEERRTREMASAEAHQKLERMTEEVDALTQSLARAREEKLASEVARAEVQRGLEQMNEEVDALARSLRRAKEEKIESAAAYSARTLETSEAQRKAEAIELDWSDKMAEQQREAERQLHAVRREVDALTEFISLSGEEQERYEIFYSEMVAEPTRIHSAIEMDLGRKLMAVRAKVAVVQRAKSELEMEKARIEAGLLWRARRSTRKLASALFGRLVSAARTQSMANNSSISATSVRDVPDLPISEPVGSADQCGSINETYEDEIHDILQSGLFDSNYYLSAYADVASANVDPLYHYMNYGWKEGRNPSESFDTNFYLETYPDVKESNVNPLKHYVKFGKSEERKKAPIETLRDISLFFDLLDQKRSVPSLLSKMTIDIVVPVYNGFEYLEPLFSSIFANTLTPYRLIVVEDASPDSRVKKFLRELRQNNATTNILLIENDDNMGFVGSVNKAVAEIQNHFVLLNSDTEVPPHWLERLMYPILEMDKVASTTPFTNSGTICSFPTFLKDNPLFENLRAEVIDDYFQFVKFAKCYLQIPTGIGFCMGVNKNVVDEIGMFDTVFGKGYCEENDWCARAEKLGYQNLHVPNLFVYHKHGGSFPSDERRRLIEHNYSILLERHPSYDNKVQECIRADSLKHLRQFLIMLLASNEAGAIVVFDNELGGGAHQFRNRLMSQSLQEGNAVFLISYKGNRDKVATLLFQFKSHNFSFSIKQPDDLVPLFTLLKIKEIVVNSFVSFSDVGAWLALVSRIRGATNCRVGFLVHDFFAICPSYTLINDSNEYCGVPGDLKVCRKCLARNAGDFRRFESHTDMPTWRAQWGTFLQCCDEITCFGNSSADILRRAYPLIRREKIVVRPHDISGRFNPIYFGSWRNTVKRIGVLGAINFAKGSNVVRELVEYIDRHQLPVKVILFGEIDLAIKSPAFEITGRYDLERLESIVLEKDIDVFLLPSIWPETFSFTADEIMQMGLPLVVFNIGAPAERVNGYALGKVIEPDDLYRTLFGDEGSIKAA